MSERMDPLIDASTKIKVSSTLDKSVGKKFLTDGSPETCWTSQQGTPQYIQLTFPKPVSPKRVEITFQGGFVGTRTLIEILENGEQKWRTLTHIYPEDVNRKQAFDLTSTEAGIADANVDSLKLVFEESSDFFGRITVYDLQLLGSVLV
ncbi:galactose-binding domain-like protein [Dichomitus squalens]|uniref:Galactose-binding domain-like protein n=1 Tax=Dichomitus squalens TaxID=114155 RepID=A0A4Q9Q7G4_9APHY|nr:uncharacterized protein DICSQDRAFT_131567 [Dichomitus squalens LYAD-421 SS1]EJF67287.1 hypothetical protein DICSQDRAFT_131567 [Dichomitus squalens LYAD-421 SS1]TBU29804.1 galactose-binding domain-like protein [Dichomitus squalens]TBU46171.1 galactose-binding domain-like protein [Dichomitus squalens]TBU62544.1 galactose-binding domain-like protein [Dichomitus squalens]